MENYSTGKVIVHLPTDLPISDGELRIIKRSIESAVHPSICYGDRNFGPFPSGLGFTIELETAGTIWKNPPDEIFIDRGIPKEIVGRTIVIQPMNCPERILSCRVRECLVRRSKDNSSHVTVDIDPVDLGNGCEVFSIISWLPQSDACSSCKNTWGIRFRDKSPNKETVFVCPVEIIRVI